MNMDLLTVGVGIVSFVIFLIIKVITFRWLRPEEILKSLNLCALAVATLPLALMAGLFATKAVQASLPAWILASLLALAVTGLLSFVYVTCIFGPYETSVRMRLVREIARGGLQGITHQELLQRYNAKTILDIRLRRLKGSGDIIEQGDTYRARNKGNFFFIFDAIAQGIKNWIE